MSELVKQENNLVDPFLSMIERVALDVNSDVSKLEKMIELHERVKDRQSKADFDKAMLGFQNKKGVIEKGAQANRTKYAKLEHMQEIVDPVLQEFGLFVRWRTEPHHDGRTLVTCICTHIHGYSETASMLISPDKSGSKNEIQADGSAITYGQRYTMKALLGLVIAEENDGRAKATITPAQVKILEKKLEYLAPEAKEKLVAYIGCELHEIEKGAFDYWRSQLDNKISKKDAE